MHVENELAEIMTIGDQEFEEYKEEILVQEEVLEPPLTDWADTPPAQGKPRCITLILNNHQIYMWCAFTLQDLYWNYMHR